MHNEFDLTPEMDDLARAIALGSAMADFDLMGMRKQAVDLVRAAQVQKLAQLPADQIARLEDMVANPGLPSADMTMPVTIYGSIPQAPTLPPDQIAALEGAVANPLGNQQAGVSDALGLLPQSRSELVSMLAPSMGGVEGDLPRTKADLVASLAPSMGSAKKAAALDVDDRIRELLQHPGIEKQAQALAKEVTHALRGSKGTGLFAKLRKLLRGADVPTSAPSKNLSRQYAPNAAQVDVPDDPLGKFRAEIRRKREAYAKDVAMRPRYLDDYDLGIPANVSTPSGRVGPNTRLKDLQPPSAPRGAPESNPLVDLPEEVGPRKSVDRARALDPIRPEDYPLGRPANVSTSRSRPNTRRVNKDEQDVLRSLRENKVPDALPPNAVARWGESNLTLEPPRASPSSRVADYEPGELVRALESSNEKVIPITSKLRWLLEEQGE